MLARRLLSNLLLAGVAFVAAGQAQASARSLAVRYQFAAAVHSDRVTVAAVLSARNAPTTYRFQYGTSASYRGGTGTLHGVRVKAGVIVSTTLLNLRPSTSYQYRVVAHNRHGFYYGRARRFATSAAGSLTTGPVPTSPTTFAGTAPTTAVGVPGASNATPTTTTTASPTPVGTITGTGSSNQTASVYWGAQIGTQFTGSSAPWDMNAVSDFATMVQKRPSLLTLNLPFMGCGSSCNYYQFPTTLMNSMRNYGAIPVLNWASMSDPFSVNQPNFRLQNVINGTYDSYITSFAEAARAWGHPFFLRFNWEMNGNWFPWGEAANGNTPGDFVAAWRHVHDIFAAVGATNATWVWCPAADPYNNMTSLSELYPGDSYVDWTCIDAYNFGSLSQPTNWQTFSSVIGSTYNRILAIAPSKPMIIGETGSTEGGGSKAAWITDLLGTQVPNNFPAIHGLIWYETASGADWPIESSTSSTNAFTAGIASPTYASSSYAALATSPIPVP